MFGKSKTRVKLGWPHAGHDKHLCYLVNMRCHEQDLESYKVLVRDASFVCEHCGRVAADKAHLCQAAKL